ncbi:heterokaryon incompatibility, partial [Cadophora sp. DSE1049]
LAELPKTFRDTVVVTRRLGIRYLWIDSLCIIQDSSMDWARESSKMQGVYAGAILNISADASTNSDVGLSLEERVGS